MREFNQTHPNSDEGLIILDCIDVRGFVLMIPTNAVGSTVHDTLLTSSLLHSRGVQQLANNVLLDRVYVLILSDMVENKIK
jgi:hypothetical protein